MKNIFILLTDQPSKLGYISESKTYHLYNNNVFLDELANAINIYITSSEEIKEGVNQWYLDNFLNKPMNSSGAQYGEKQNVIILTTDPTLIADGVQAIDDEFLEWFVKNSSCKFIEVNKKLVEFPLTFKMMYKIIIPQEEPKQEKEEYFKHLEKDKKEFAEEWEEIRQEFGLGKQDSNEDWKELEDAKLCEPLKSWDEPKQETLEEAAKEFYPPTTTDLICSPKLVRDAFKAGAKWQAEGMYSEEEVKDILIRSKTAYYSSIIEWFEQNEKK